MRPVPRSVARGKAPRKPRHSSTRPAGRSCARGGKGDWEEAGNAGANCRGQRACRNRKNDGELGNKRVDWGCRSRLWRRNASEDDESEEQQVEQVVEALMMSRHGLVPQVYANCRKKKRMRMKIPQTDRKCDYCGTSATAQWRSGPREYPVLCNACGVRHRKGKLKAKGTRTACSAREQWPEIQQQHQHQNLTRPLLSSNHCSLAPPLCEVDCTTCSNTATPSPNFLPIHLLSHLATTSEFSWNTEMGSSNSGASDCGHSWPICRKIECVGGVVPKVEQVSYNRFLDDTYCFSLRWGAKKRRSAVLSQR